MVRVVAKVSSRDQFRIYFIFHIRNFQKNTGQNHERDNLLVLLGLVLVVQLGAVLLRNHLEPVLGHVID